MKALSAALAGVVFLIVLVGASTAGALSAVSGGATAPTAATAIPTTGTQSSSPSTGASSEGGVREAVLLYAYAQLGDAYLYGGTTPAGFDCSGLTQAAYASAGIALARTSEAQWLTTTHDTGSPAPGDLVFFNPGEDVPGLPGHVGIYLGDGYMIDAPHTGTVVTISTVSDFGNYIGAAYPI